MNTILKTSRQRMSKRTKSKNLLSYPVLHIFYLAVISVLPRNKPIQIRSFFISWAGSWVMSRNSRFYPSFIGYFHCSIVYFHWNKRSLNTLVFSRQFNLLWYISSLLSREPILHKFWVVNLIQASMQKLDRESGSC